MSGSLSVAWAQVSTAHSVQGVCSASDHPSFQSPLCYLRPRSYGLSLCCSSLWDNLQPSGLFKTLFLQKKKKSNMELNLPSDTTLGIWERSVPSGFSTNLCQLGLQTSPGPSSGLLKPFLLSSKISQTR